MANLIKSVVKHVTGAIVPATTYQPYKYKKGKGAVQTVVKVAPASVWWNSLAKGDPLEFELGDNQLLDWMQTIRDNDGHGIENAGYGVHQYDDNGKLTVPWWTVADDPLAHGSGVSTDMNQAVIESLQAGYEGRITVQWHTHPNMSTFWSTTDHGAMKELVEAQRQVLPKGEMLFLVIDEFDWWGTLVRWDGEAITKHEVPVLWRGKYLHEDHKGKTWVATGGKGTTGLLTAAGDVYGDWDNWAEDAEFWQDWYERNRRQVDTAADVEAARKKAYVQDYDWVQALDDDADTDLLDRVLTGTWSDDIEDYEPLMRMLDATTFIELHSAWRASTLPYYVDYLDMVDDPSLWEEVAKILNYTS